MVNEIQSQAYRLFKSLSERPEAERANLIAERARTEPETAALAANMLREFLEGEEREPGAALEPGEWDGKREGSVVSGWTIEQNIESGGFGRVYRAWRSAPGGREEAAIKFLDMAPGQAPRFLRERQTLADLNHKGICKFIDGGTTPGGVPYMVMEYVSGLPITRYCDYHHLTITERLNLFVNLCHAVEYAHDHRVLHRDLKPANILVTAQGAVRVLDLGVAMLLEPATGRTRRLTKLGETPWTKTHASPEQIRGEGISFATDVYALGVLLYELVTGQLPFSGFELSGSDWRHVLEERYPLPPSQALLMGLAEPPGNSNRAETAAGSRGTSLSRLRRVLAGDLDAVILKTIRKNPRHRYQRVDRLRSDIESFLRGFPVTARRSKVWDRVRTWSGRHRLLAAFGAAWALWLCVVLCAGFLQDAIYKDHLREERNAIEQLRYVMEKGLPGIAGALPQDSDARPARLLIAQIHTGLLQRVQAISDYTLTNLDSSLALSALQCGKQWSVLGDPSAALAVTSSVVPRIARRYQLERSDPLWRELYVGILRQRSEMHTLLGQRAEASDVNRRLAKIEAGHN